MIDMVRKQLDRVYKEPFLSCAGVSLNTNDSMIVSGNVNGDVTVRNLLSKEGTPINRGLEMHDAGHDGGTSEVILQHFQAGEKTCAITQVKFSVVKRHILASAYKNGQIVIWDTNGIFTKNPVGLAAGCKKFVFNSHQGQACTGIAFS